MSFLQSLTASTKAISHPTKIQVRHGSGAKQFRSSIGLKPHPRRIIPVGKARPPIYHQFDQKVILTDGSSYTRRTLYPKLELRSIFDQRNHPLWNPSGNFTVIDLSSAARIKKFNEKYGFTDSKKSTSGTKTDKKVESSTTEEAKENSVMDDYLDLMSHNVQDVQSGGKLQRKTKVKKTKNRRGDN